MPSLGGFDDLLSLFGSAVLSVPQFQIDADAFPVAALVLTPPSLTASRISRKTDAPAPTGTCMVSDAQERVAEFVATHDLDAPPVYRLLDLTSEIGELAKEVNESTGYGSNPEAVEIAQDELGDTLFALLALAEAADIDAENALDTALEKYERRLDESDTASSGEL